MATRLSDLDCRRAKPGAELHDGNNLVLRAGARRKTWTLVWRDGGRVRKARLGDYPALGLSAARIAAHDGMARVRQGLAPVGKPAGPTMPPLPPPKPPAGPTIETVLRNYLRLHVRASARDPDQIEWVIDRLLDPLHDKAANSLTRADITKFIDEVSEQRGRGSAYRAGSILRAAFRFAVRRGEIETDPTHLLVLPAGKQRERVLSDAELAAIWHSAVPVWSRLARVVLLTGLRLREAAEAPLSELSADLWLIPGARMKSGKPHAVPLFPALSAQLGELAGARWLFRSPRRFDQPVAGFYGGLGAVQRKSGTSDWTWHDMRRTVATGLQRLGAPHDVIEAVLAHRKPGIAAVYHRHEYLAERREWLQRWAEFCAQAGELE